jgi:hypothetical protein
VVLAALVFGCTRSAEPSALAIVSGRALNVDSRGSPAVIVRINRAEATHVPCQAGAVITPGEEGIPALPWDLEVIREGDGTLVFSRRITQLPQWLLLFGNQVELSATPIQGPAGPPCPTL